MTPTHEAWSLVVSRSDLSEARIIPDQGVQRPLKAGEATLRVEKFGVTANSITYAAMGDWLYWRFFPAPEGLGKVPVWGYAVVEQSSVPELQVGQRVFGYFPLASHLRVQAKTISGALVDVAPHRAQLPSFYNRYGFVGAAAPGEDYRPLLLFGTSFLLDDFIDEMQGFGTRCIVMTSASSKTALGTAFLLRKRGFEVIGLTSTKHKDFVERTDYYTRVVCYDDIGTAALSDPFVVIDFSGNPDVLRALHQRSPGRIAYVCAVGRTHWNASTDVESLPEPKPKLFFAPERVEKRMADWGPEKFGRSHGEAWAAFIADVPRWLELHYDHGSDGALRTYLTALRGDLSPARGQMVRLDSEE